MSSVTTAIPSGPANTPGLGANYKGNKWCIQGLVDIFESDTPPYTYNECANSTLSEKKSNFETICCDGSIIDTTYSIWGQRSISDYQLDISNLVCCRAGGQRIMGGISPIDSDYTHCSASSVSAPLASLAATNTDNAALYTVIYESAQGLSDGGLGDWTRTETPTCLWVQTAGGETTLPMTTVTVPAADITTLPPPSTDRFGYTIDYSTKTASGKSESGSNAKSESGSARETSSATGERGAASAETAASASPTDSSATGSRMLTLPSVLLVIALQLYAILY